MKRLSIIVGLASLFTLAGCTDAQIGKLKALGSSAEITCYSGTKMIFDGRSTGKVSSSEHSDGYYFTDAKDGKLREVSGNCVITYGN